MVNFVRTRAKLGARQGSAAVATPKGVSSAPGRSIHVAGGVRARPRRRPRARREHGVARGRRSARSHRLPSLHIRGRSQRARPGGRAPGSRGLHLGRLAQRAVSLRRRPLPAVQRRVRSAIDAGDRHGSRPRRRALGSQLARAVLPARRALRRRRRRPLASRRDAPARLRHRRPHLDHDQPRAVHGDRGRRDRKPRLCRGAQHSRREGGGDRCRGGGAESIVGAPGWPGGEAFGILVDADGTMLVGRGARLVRRAPGGAVFEDVGHVFVETITNIVRDRAGRLWLRAGEHLWMQPRLGAPFVDRSAAYLGAHPGADGLRLALSATGTLLIPTSVGLIEVDGDDAHFVATDLDEDARSIKSAWLDREGSLWLASLGLHHELGRGLWRTISTKDGLPAPNLWRIPGLHDGRTAVGTDAGVVVLGGDRAETVSTPSVIAMVEQPAGVLWIVTARKLVRYELATQHRSDVGPDLGLPEGRLLVIAREADRK